jgi:hypothetical protein
MTIKGTSKNFLRHAELVSASPCFRRLRVKPAMTGTKKLEVLIGISMKNKILIFDFIWISKGSIKNIH